MLKGPDMQHKRLVTLLLSYAYERVSKCKYNHLVFHIHFHQNRNSQKEKLVLLYFIWHGWRHKNTQDTIQTSCEQLQTSVKSEFILHRGEQDHNGWFYNIVLRLFQAGEYCDIMPNDFYTIHPLKPLRIINMQVILAIKSLQYIISLLIIMH